MKKISTLLGLTVLSLAVTANAKTLNTEKLSIPSGTINLAVLNTAVESEQQPPHALIKATITDGKYKGAQLSGELMNLQNKPKVIFTSMKLNGKNKPITAFAIDPDTARTAIRGKIDSEYLNKNGGILAASFMQAYSKQSETNENPNNAMIGSTIKINSGTDIGILFTPKLS